MCPFCGGNHRENECTKWWLFPVIPIQGEKEQDETQGAKKRQSKDDHRVTDDNPRLNAEDGK